MSRTKERPKSAGRTVEVGVGASALVVILVVAAVGGLAWFSSRRPAARHVAGPVSTAGSTSTGPAAGDPSVGSLAAPVVIDLYSDFQCPNCHQFATQVLPWLRTTWIASGFVRVVYHDFAVRGEGSVLAAEAARCAGEQGSFWAYYDGLFAALAGDDSPDADSLAALASGLGLDADRLRACLQSGRYRADVQAATQAALAQGFAGTPTYLVNGRKVEGAIEISRWEELFQAFRSDIARATEEAGR